MAQLVKWNEIDLKGYLPLSENDQDDFLVKLKLIMNCSLKQVQGNDTWKFKILFYHQVSVEASCVSGFEIAGQAEVRDTLGIAANTHQV
jgi:hypothetical protein